MGRITETVAQSTQSKETENASQQLYSTVLYLLKFCNLVIYIDFAIFLTEKVLNFIARNVNQIAKTTTFGETFSFRKIISKKKHKEICMRVKKREPVNCSTLCDRILIFSIRGKSDESFFSFCGT